MCNCGKNVPSRASAPHQAGAQPVPIPLPGARGLVKLRYIGVEKLPVFWNCKKARYMFTEAPRYVDIEDAATLEAIVDTDGNKLFEVVP